MHSTDSTDAHAPRPEKDDTVMAHTGFGYFPLALVARLPFAMMIVGVLTLVVAARGSIELGGLNSAMVGLGAACFGPLIGAAADRFGQRPTLLISGAVNSVALASLAWVAFSPAADWVMLLNAFVIGASAPQISPMSRSRLVMIISDKLPTSRHAKVLNSTMAYESAADEIIFVFGPVIVGLLATFFGPQASVFGAALLTLIFVTAFALHRTSALAQSHAERAETLAPAAELRRPALLVVVLGIFGVGLFFGAMLTSLTSFMQELGAPERAGLVYGMMGIGSALLALGVALFPPAFTRRARWLVFGLTLLVGTLILQFTDTLTGMILSLLVMGLGIGPTLVTQYSFGADRSPIGRSATVMTILGSAIVVGQSISSAVTGYLAEAFGSESALLMPLVSAAIVVVAGVANWFLTPSGREASTRTGSITLPL
ncbi:MULTISPECIES: MFS transporter [unclassified Leucobacter]|uniref:MFS transporter n=1 Tax=unclassified Leucobacter TaxID=2621730 RepID=UPI00165E8EB6|nr:MULTISPECIES: MFS transporter [unclassified Leucobacter]MBC9935801.1 MFS transporter [Leucobacter sp. cx-87]